MTRLNCMVPFCHRSRGERKGTAKIRRGQEWICADHWRGVPMRLKWLKRTCERRARLAEKSGKNDIADYYWGKAALFWVKCREAAIERAAGIR